MKHCTREHPVNFQSRATSRKHTSQTLWKKTRKKLLQLTVNSTLHSTRLKSKLSKLKVIQFSDCDFEEIESLKAPEYDILAFASCSGMEDLKMPKTRVLRMVGCEVDFLNINPKELEKLYIQNSEIVNYSTLEYISNLLEVNFDGSKVFDLDGNEVDEIKVSDATQLSFEDEFHLEDR